MLQAVEEEETPLQRRLNELGRTFRLGLPGGVCPGVGVGLLRGEGNPLDLFMIAVVWRLRVCRRVCRLS